LIWPKEFADRLESWTALRNLAQSQDLETSLATINQWWFNSPWKAYYLHWDDQATWPDPWQLLNDDIYCDVAKALGILYTISMLDRADMADATMVLTDDHRNLVLVDKTKYILNWSSDTVVNTFQEVKIVKRLKQHQIK
jgi:hypothetical protein